MAMRLRQLADSLLVAPAMVSGLPPQVVQGFVEGTTTGAVAAAKAPKKKKTTAYHKKYKTAFKRQAAKYKKKNGQWKKDGFRRAVKEAHRIAGGKKR